MSFKLKNVFFDMFFQGEVQYFIGVQLDGSKHVEPVRNVIEETAVKEGEELVWNPSLFKILIS